MIYERLAQFGESSLKTLYSIFGFKYHTSYRKTEDKLDVIASDATEFYHEASIKTISDVKLKTSFVLKAQDNRFGEWSGMSFDSEGNVVFVSDRGNYLKTELSLNNKTREFTNTKIGHINAPHKIKDFEELVIFGKDYFISNEADIHELLFYKNGNFSAEPSKVATPSWQGDLSKNNGIEAFGMPSSNSFFAISEYNNSPTEDNLHKAYYWTTDNRYDSITSQKEFNYISKPGYGVSGLCFLENGDMLVLERTYTKVYYGAAEIYEIDVKYVKNPTLNDNNDPIEGSTIIHIDNDSPNSKYGYADNFESIAVKEQENHTNIYLLTDDNRAPFQRTIFLEFEMKNQVLLDDICPVLFGIDNTTIIEF